MRSAFWKDSVPSACSSCAQSMPTELDLLALKDHTVSFLRGMGVRQEQSSGLLGLGQFSVCAEAELLVPRNLSGQKGW